MPIFHRNVGFTEYLLFAMRGLTYIDSDESGALALQYILSGAWHPSTGNNAAWVSVGCDHDTAAFAVQTLRNWWRAMGSVAYPGADCLLICADGGGSNGYRTRLGKSDLQKFADETGLEVIVSDFPPGASNWNIQFYHDELARAPTGVS